MFKRLTNVSDQEVLIGLSGLVRTENETTMEILFYLIEVEQRELYLPLGYSSLFDYCQRKLLYSEPAAVRRIKAARCIKEFPEVYELLQKREVSLSTVCLFAQFLKAENQDEIFAGVRGKSKTEVETFLTRYRTSSKKPAEKIRPLSFQAAAKAPPLQLFANTTEAKREEAPLPPPQVSIATAPVEERFELRFSISKESLAKLNRAKVLEAQGQGKAPSLEQVFDVALDEYLKANDPAERQKRREAKAAKKKEGLPSPETVVESSTKRSRHVPRAIHDQVFVRDQGKCSFVGADGTRCGSTVGIQFDHVVPFGLNGETSAANGRILCKSHNLYEAERIYGKEVMAPYHKAKDRTQCRK